MTNFAPVNLLPVNTWKRSQTATDYLRFLADDTSEEIFFIDLTFRDRIELLPLSSAPAGNNVLPVNVTRNSSMFHPTEQQIYFSSKNWIGKPSDPIRANFAPYRRLKAAFRIRRSTPYFLNEESRIQTTIASTTLDNSNRDLDYLAFEKTVEGYRAPIWHGPLNGQFDKMQRLIKPKVKNVETDGDDLIINFENESSQFSTIPLQKSRYDGTGGINGDPTLKDQLKPLVFGSVYNMEPTLIYAAQLIYQVNGGPVSGIGPVREGGRPLAFDQDYPSFAALAAATIPQGSYGTCVTNGVFKLGLQPINKLTCNVRGDAGGGLYRQDAGEILLYVLTVFAGRQTSLFNISSFSTLSKQSIGWYNERKDYTIEDFINIILKPENAVLGDTSTGLIGVIKHRPPQSQASTKTITLRERQLDVRSIDVFPLASQTILYGKNWSPYEESDFDAGLSEAERIPLRAPWRKANASSGLISAFTGITSFNGQKESWFAYDEDVAAQNQANEDVQLYGRSVIGLKIKDLGREAFGLKDGEVVKVICPKFGFDAGRNVVVLGIDQEAKGEKVEVEVVA